MIVISVDLLMGLYFNTTKRIYKNNDTITIILITFMKLIYTSLILLDGLSPLNLSYKMYFYSC